MDELRRFNKLDTDDACLKRNEVIMIDTKNLKKRITKAAFASPRKVVPFISFSGNLSH